MAFPSNSKPATYTYHAHATYQYHRKHATEVACDLPPGSLLLLWLWGVVVCIKQKEKHGECQDKDKKHKSTLRQPAPRYELADTSDKQDRAIRHAKLARTRLLALTRQLGQFKMLSSLLLFSGQDGGPAGCFYFAATTGRRKINTI